MKTKVVPNNIIFSLLKCFIIINLHFGHIHMEVLDKQLSTTTILTMEQSFILKDTEEKYYFPYQ